MNLSDIGEFGLIHRIAPQFLENVKDNVFGIGDDCAVIPQKNEKFLLVTTDLLIEDIHFLRNKITPREQGFKALAVNLNDIAGMGGTPTAAFLSIGLPKDIKIEWLDQFFAGIRDLSEQTSTPLLGGDTTKSKERIVINIAVLGEATPQKIKYRSTAIERDIIFVTAELGDSGCGLYLIFNDLDDETNKGHQQIVKAHHQPRPHIEEGKWIAGQKSVHALLDVSDGIDSDIRRIMEESSVGAKIDVNDIPVSSSLKSVCRQHSWNAFEIAATGGEDYCLLGTADPAQFNRLAKAFQQQFDKPLYTIGRIEEGDTLVYYQDDVILDFTKHGWDHFK